MPIRLVLCAVVGLIVVAGCSSTLDASGQWGGGLEYIEVNGEEETAGLSLDLSQSEEDGSLSGTMSLEADDEATSTPIDSGEVGEDGGVQIEIESQDPFDSEPIVFDGEITGEQMEGEVFGFSDEGATFSVEKDAGIEQGSSDGEDVQSSDDESDYVAGDSGPSEEDAQEAARRYQDLSYETSGAVEDLDGRIDTLEGAEEDLEEALGPGGSEPGLSDCIEDPASCEAVYLEDQVAEDLETFEEEGFNAEGCDDATDYEEYAEYTGFDEEGGETYITERASVEEASSGLAEDARSTLADVQETEAAYNEARETAEEANSGFNLGEPTYRPSEIEPMVGEAAEAEERAEAALGPTDERYEEYAERADAAVEEARALYARAGCAA